MTRFTKKDEMFEHAKAKNHTFFVAWYPPHPKLRPSFQSYENAEAFLRVYERQKGACEVYTGKQPMQLFFDVDAYHDEKPAPGFLTELVQRLLDRTQRALRDLLGRPELTLDSVIAEGSRPLPDGRWKSSSHVNVRNIAFENTSVLKRFVSQLGEDVVSAVDMSVYRPGLLRMVESPKWDDETQTPLRVTSPAGTHVRDTLVSVVPDSAMVISSGQVPEHQRATRGTKRKRAHSSVAPCPRTEQTPQQVALVAQLQAMLTPLDGTLTVMPAARPQVFPLRQTGTRTCLTSGESHIHNNAFLCVRDNGEVHYHCHSQRCPNSRVLGNIDTPTEEAITTDPWAGVDIHVHPADVEFVQRFQCGRGQRCLVVRAAMGMGKTTQLRKWMDVNKDRRVLMVSTRIAFGRTLRGLFPSFKAYNEPGAMSADKLICQYESLHKLAEGTPPFDVVVVDEVRSVIRNMTCEVTNGPHIKANADLLRALMQSARRTFLLDADMDCDGAVHALVSSVFSPQEVRLERYERVKLQRTMICHAEKDWYQAIAHDIQQGKKLVVCVGTKTQGRMVVALCTEHKAGHRFYYSGCDDALLLDFTDLNQVWGDPQLQVIIYTSKVTVGADYTGPCDRVYLAGHHAGASPRDMLQMLGRVRNPTDTQVHVRIDAHAKAKPLVSYRACTTELRLRAETLKGCLHHFEPHFQGGTLQWTPDWFTQLQAWNRREQLNSRSNWRQQFLQFCQRRQYPVHAAPPAETASPLVQQLSAAADPDEALYQRVAAMPWPQLEQEREHAERNVQQQVASAPDKMLVAVYHVQKHWRNRLTHEEFQCLRYDMHKVYRVAALLRGSAQHCIQMDCKQLSSQPWANLAKLHTPVFIGMHRLAKALGLKSVLDTDTVFTSADIKRHAHLIQRTCSRVMLLLQARLQASTPKGQLANTWRTALGAGLTCTARKRTGRNTRVHCYTLDFPHYCNSRTLLDYARLSNFFPNQDADGDATMHAFLDQRVSAEPT
jgi:hypothetical protein